MTALVTGSAGHLGEALVRALREAGEPVRGIDIKATDFTDRVGSIADRSFVRAAMDGVDRVYHAATLHKPHVATHTRQDFIDTNISGTLNLLEEAVEAGVRAFVFTSTTSVFGEAMVPAKGEPAVWVTEELEPVPKNIYGVTKLAAENLCRLIHRKLGLPCLVLRTSRFFPEDDDHRGTREAFLDENHKTNEYLNRRVELEDVVSAHQRAAESARELGFGRYIISATTPFSREDTVALREQAAERVEARVPGCREEYDRRGWRLPDEISRVYDNALARRELGWKPRHDFASILEKLRSDEDPRSALARAVGSKGYHEQAFEDGPYPVDEAPEGDD